MDNFNELYKKIGNESLEALWDVVLTNKTPEIAPNCRGKTDVYNRLINSVPDDDLRADLENMESQLTSLAMYQGFVLGFREAVRLILEGQQEMNKKELLAVYAQENEIARDQNTDAKILGAAEYAHLIGAIDDHEFEFYKMKYQKSAL